jgi:hypothetical protein
MNYMTCYRNREAFQLFQEHSMHLRQEREADESASARAEKTFMERYRSSLRREEHEPTAAICPVELQLQGQQRCL